MKRTTKLKPEIWPSILLGLFALLILMIMVLSASCRVQHVYPVKNTYWKIP